MLVKYLAQILSYFVKITIDKEIDKIKLHV